MAILSFSLSPEATGRVYELLICLAKFGEAVSLEARREKLTFTTLNSSRTAYSSFALDARAFFICYEFNATDTAKGGDRFTCQLLNKALQSVFKGRATDARGRETIIDRCDVNIQEQPDMTECRLVVKMQTKYGLTKTYRLTYESTEIMHALFDKTAATQGWRISSRVLREYVEYFGPKTEQLDILAQEGKATFTSFTEKIQDGKEVLKQPLETAIAIHTDDFEDFHMQENMHLVISVKDFRAIVTHAETLRCPIHAYFSYPTKPLQFSYQNFGMHCEFTLMTTGDFRAASSTPNPNFVSTRSMSRQPTAAPTQHNGRPASDMAIAPPLAVQKPLSSQNQRPSFRSQVHEASFAEPDPDSDRLFVSNADEDDDHGWDPVNYDQAEDEMLGWDASNQDPSASFRPTFRDSGVTRQPARRARANAPVNEEGLEPTQRLSQLHGLFD